MGDEDENEPDTHNWTSLWWNTAKIVRRLQTQRKEEGARIAEGLDPRASASRGEVVRAGNEIEDRGQPPAVRGRGRQ